MKLEFDLFPFLVGTGIYVLSRVLSFRPTRGKKVEQPEVDADNEQELRTRLYLEPCAEPGPDWEEPVEREDIRDRRRRQCGRHVGLAVLGLGAALALGLLVCMRCLEAGTTNDDMTDDAASFNDAASPPVIAMTPTAVTDCHSASSAPSDVAPALRMNLRRQKTAVNTIAGTTYYKSAYYGTVNVGQPARSFSVVFDTGSGHLILPTTYCASATCRAHKRYSPSRSETALAINFDGELVAGDETRDQITVSFGTGEVTGLFVDDIVCFEESAMMTNSSMADASEDELMAWGCRRIRIIAATEMSEEPFKTFKFDGVMGLGLTGLSQTKEFNFLSVLGNHGQNWGNAMNRVFGVFLASDENADDSEIAFGGYATERIQGDVSWNDVVQPELGHWMVRVNRILVDGQPVSFCEAGGCKAVVDTGTSLLAVPPQSFLELFELLRHPASKDGLCNHDGPMLTFELEHFEVTLGAEDYARVDWIRRPARFYPGASKQTRPDVRCKPMMMSMPIPAPVGPKLFIFGEPVLRKYYTIYDADTFRVGFGLAAQSESVPSSEDSKHEDTSWFWEADDE